MASKSILLQILYLLLRPIARFCYARGLHIQDLLEAAKRAFYEVAAEEFARMEEKVNVSRLSAATGIHRRDIMRLQEEATIQREPQGLISRLIGQWQLDKRFVDRDGKPRILNISEEQNEFHELVKSLSQDLNPGTLLFELERLGVIERSLDSLRLKTRVYVPSRDMLESYRMLARDSEYLHQAVQENILEKRTSDSWDKPNLHGTTEFDNIDTLALPEIRSWLLKEGSAFHKKVRDYLAQFDADTVPERTKRGSPNWSSRYGARVAFCSFSITQFGRTGANFQINSPREEKR